jgi:RNA polymerase sigma-70 factor (ECF subfamily)
MPEPDHAGGGRESRFRALYLEHYGAIRAYAVRRLASAEDAGDAVADTFTVAWRRIADVPPPPQDRLWLYGVARRVVAGRQRSLRRGRSLLARLAAIGGQADGVAAAPTADPADGRVIEALERLRPGEREALALVVWDQLSHAEAARVLGCSENAVGIRVHRARARLRAALDPGGQPSAARPAADAMTRDR